MKSESEGPAYAVFMTSKGSGTSPLPVASRPKIVTGFFVVPERCKDSKECLRLGSFGAFQRLTQ